MCVCGVLVNLVYKGGLAHVLTCPSSFRAASCLAYSSERPDGPSVQPVVLTAALSPPEDPSGIESSGVPRRYSEEPSYGLRGAAAGGLERPSPEDGRGLGFVTRKTWS